MEKSLKFFCVPYFLNQIYLIGNYIVQLGRSRQAKRDERAAVVALARDTRERSGPGGLVRHERLEFMLELGRLRRQRLRAFVSIRTQLNNESPRCASGVREVCEAVRPALQTKNSRCQG